MCITLVEASMTTGMLGGKTLTWNTPYYPKSISKILMSKAEDTLQDF